MTVQSTITSKTFYPGGALASQSLAGLVFFAADDVRVEVLDADGVPSTLLARDEDYTLSGDGATGTASITPTAAWAADVRWYVSRSTAPVQPEAFPVQQPLSSAAVERGFNRSILIAQEQADALGRAPLALPGQTPPPFNVDRIGDGQVLALVGGKFQGVNNDPASAADSAAQAALERIASQAARGETEDLRDETQELRDEAEALKYGALAAVVALGGYYPAARLHIPRGLTAIAITAAGSGGTNGTYTCPLTGDNLSVDAYATVVVAGGAVTSASVAAPGLYIGASPTAGLVDVSSITGLTGATLTPTIGYLKTSGNTWLTDTDPPSAYLSLFRNESNVATEIDPQFDPMSAGRAYEWAESAGEPGGPGTKSAKGWAEWAATFGASPKIFEPRIVPGRNDNVSNGIPILRTPEGKVLLRAAATSLIARMVTAETGLSALQALVGPAPLRVETFEPRIVPGRSSADTPLVRTPSGKALIWRTAQDNTAINALTARVDRTLDSHGMPRRPMYGEWYLRRARAKFQALAAGIAGTQMAIYLPGDSWVDNVAYSGRVFASRLRATYGNAAIGWVGFGPQPLDANFWTTSSGTWAVVDETAASPDIYAVTSATPGSQRVINASSLAAVPTGAKLQWKGTADGVIRYRTNTGTWTTLNVQGSGIQHADLVNLPTGPSWSMTFEVVSGSVDLRGVIFAGTASGVIIHKGGNNGSTTADWAGVDRAEYIASIAQLPIDLAIIPFGVNDQGAGLSDTTFLANTLEIIDRIRTAKPTTGGQPGPDILVSIPPELKNRLALGQSMVPYWQALLNAADEHRFAVVGLPPVFGSVPADYDAWMDTDLIHPAPISLDPLQLASNLITRTWCETIGATKAI